MLSWRASRPVTCKAAPRGDVDRRLVRLFIRLWQTTSPCHEYEVGALVDATSSRANGSQLTSSPAVVISGRAAGIHS